MSDPLAIESIAARFVRIKPRLRLLASHMAAGTGRKEAAALLRVTYGTLTNLEKELRRSLDIPADLPLELQRELVTRAWQHHRGQSTSDISPSTFATALGAPADILDIRILPVNATSNARAKILLGEGFKPELATGSTAGAFLVFVKREGAS